MYDQSPAGIQKTDSGGVRGRNGVGKVSFELFYESYIALFTPQRLVIVLVQALAVICAMMLIKRISRMSFAQMGLLSAAFIYIALIYQITVFGRVESGSGVVLTPFSSYRDALLYHSKVILSYNLLNIAVLMPAGVLMEEAAGRTNFEIKDSHGKVVRQNMGRAMIPWITMLTLLVSLSIEVMQVFMDKGVFEVDDVIHNTLGGFLSSWLWYRIRRSSRAFCKDVSPEISQEASSEALPASSKGSHEAGTAL